MAIRPGSRASRSRRLHSLVGALFASTLLCAAAAEARDACPEDAVPEFFRRYVQLEIQASCPCGEPADRAAYRRCARDLAEVLVEQEVTRPDCGRKLSRELRRSTCGRPESVVCCVTKSNGAHPHHVTPTAKLCESTPGRSRCISPFTSVAAGCDTSGCVAPFCGNEVIEAGETCDPPVAVLCDDSCQTIPCEDVFPPCGNLTLDDGETCEPPGVGACTRECRLAACAPPRSGETAVACVDGPAYGTLRIDVAASPAGYLVVWEASHRRPTEILARRLNTDGIAMEEAAIEVSAAEPCGAFRMNPAVGSDGTAWYVIWKVFGEASRAWDGPTFFQAVHGRRLEFSGGDSQIHEFARVLDDPNPRCGSNLYVSDVSRSSRTAISWLEVEYCSVPYMTLISRSPTGAELTFDSGQTAVTPAVGGFAGDIRLPGFPVSSAMGAAGLDSSAEGTLRAWNAYHFESPARPLIAAHWTIGSVFSPTFELSTRNAATTNPFPAEPSPAVASGPTAFLVAWAQGAANSVTIQTEIRALRVSRTDGRLDPDGGLLIATVPGGVVGVPDAVFDGERWFVAWVEATASGNELRAVSVETDGQIVDLNPRLLAENVTAARPSLASMGDGRALVAFTRPEGESIAVRTMLVDP